MNTMLLETAIYKPEWMWCLTMKSLILHTYLGKQVLAPNVTSGDEENGWASKTACPSSVDAALPPLSPPLPDERLRITCSEKLVDLNRQLPPSPSDSSLAFHGKFWLLSCLFEVLTDPPSPGHVSSGIHAARAHAWITPEPKSLMNFVSASFSLSRVSFSLQSGFGETELAVHILRHCYLFLLCLNRFSGAVANQASGPRMKCLEEPRCSLDEIESLHCRYNYHSAWAEVYTSVMLLSLS